MGLRVALAADAVVAGDPLVHAVGELAAVAAVGGEGREDDHVGVGRRVAHGAGHLHDRVDARRHEHRVVLRREAAAGRRVAGHDAGHVEGQPLGDRAAQAELDLVVAGAGVLRPHPVRLHPDVAAELLAARPGGDVQDARLRVAELRAVGAGGHRGVFEAVDAHLQFGEQGAAAAPRPAVGAPEARAHRHAVDVGRRFVAAAATDLEAR